MGKPTTGRAVRAGGLKSRGYFAATRDSLVAIAVTLPLLLLYNAGLLYQAVFEDRVTGNATDLLTSLVLPHFGLAGFLAVNGALVLASVVLVAVLVHRGRLHLSQWALLCVEGLAWGLVIGLGVTSLLREASIGLGVAVRESPMCPGVVVREVHVGLGVMVREVSVPQVVSSSAGAGYWEELVFRLLGVGVPAGVAGRFFHGKGARWKVAVVAAMAVVVSSVLFSLAHYLGGQESPEAYTFSYRTIAGAVFAAIFLIRGFAVAAYSHFLYDVWVMLF